MQKIKESSSLLLRWTDKIFIEDEKQCHSVQFFVWENIVNFLKNMLFMKMYKWICYLLFNIIILNEFLKISHINFLI